MGSKMLNSCCGCYTLKIGTIISGVLGILLAIVTIVVVLTTRIDFKTIVSIFIEIETVLITFSFLDS